LEMERIKGSNPWCLWWWWWWWWNCMFFPKELYSSSSLLRLKKKFVELMLKLTVHIQGVQRDNPLVVDVECSIVDIL
jgi:hypothetical protein